MIERSQIIWLAVWGASIFASSLCSGLETGSYSLNRVRLDIRAKRTNPIDRAARTIRGELEQPERLLATLLIGNNVVHFLAAESMHNVLHPMSLSEGLEAVINTLVIAPVLFVIGEAVPKELFRIQAERLTYRFAGALWLIRSLLTLIGVLWFVRSAARLVERLAGLSSSGVIDARQRISVLLKEGASHGVLSESQVTLLDRALAFQGVTVGDEMTPWSRVRTVPVDADHTRALRLIGDCISARLPVVDRNGSVVGVLRQVDMHLRPTEPVSKLMTPPVRLKPQTRVSQALRDMSNANARIAIVVDDAGRALGIVTTRDLVEPLTGELVAA